MTWDEEAAYTDALIRRLVEVRTRRNWTQDQMATALGVPLDRYKKYEYRSPIPHYLIPRLSLTCDVDIEWFMTGKPSRASALPPRPATTKKLA